MIPYQPQNLTAEQADGSILLTWRGSLGATSYQIERSTDGTNFSILDSSLSNSYIDSFPGIGIKYYYRVAGISIAGAFALATLTFTGQPIAGDTVTIANVVLTAGTDFVIGGTTALTITNLVNAINILPSLQYIVTATNVGLVITIKSVNMGPEGNGLQFSEALTNVVGVGFSSGLPQTQGVYSTTASMIAAPPGEMSLYELRLRSQQTADRVESDFVGIPEWNAFLRLAMYELYDLLITAYEDYNIAAPVYINTNSTIQNYPLPDGTNYIGGTFDGLSSPTPTGTGALGSLEIVVSSVSGLSVGQYITDTTNNSFIQSNSFITKILGNTITLSLPLAGNLSGDTLSLLPAPRFYKLSGVDLGVNTSNNAWVTLNRYDFIDRNAYVYPNSTSTIYGVYNMRYRIMGNNINFIPVPAGNQQIRITYAPVLPALLADTSLTVIGWSGYLRYVEIRAAKYALDKEEGTDTSKLDNEILFLKQRIEQSASNRDQGQPDTISETRKDSVYGGTGWGQGGGQGGW